MGDRKLLRRCFENNDASLKGKRRLEADARGVAQFRGLGRTWVGCRPCSGRVSLVEYPSHS